MNSDVETAFSREVADAAEVLQLPHGGSAVVTTDIDGYKFEEFPNGFVIVSIRDDVRNEYNTVFKGQVSSRLHLALALMEEGFRTGNSIGGTMASEFLEYLADKLDLGHVCERCASELGDRASGTKGAATVQSNDVARDEQPVAQTSEPMEAPDATTYIPL